MLTGYDNDPLIAQLRAHEIGHDSQFWSFKKAAMRKGAHALLHYPAMMVPSLQGLILKSIATVSPETSSVLDPFVGSGTVLVEAMEQGLNFDGIDINPLAGLACLAKSGPYYIDAFDEKKAELSINILLDHRTHTPKDFRGLKKWFSTEVAQDLAKIQYHIRREPSLWARRLFWLALCRVIRSSCNSRMSTYKLHIKAKEENVDPVNPYFLYSQALDNFSQHLREQKSTLLESGYLHRGRYTGDIGVEIADNTSQTQLPSTKQYDVIMTSPPYGDNSTTIPYGQYAYLPLNWIDLDDIDPNINNALFSNTHATDAASLGGSLRDSAHKRLELGDKYPTAREFIDRLADNKYGIQRFVSFFWDLEKSVQKIAEATKNGGYQSWTIGNRKIGGFSVPMGDLLQDMLEGQGMNLIGKIDRDIHKKKMPSRNKSTDTMTRESILLARMHRPVAAL